VTDNEKQTNEDIRLENLQFSIRTRNVLRKLNIQTLDQLAKTKENDLRGMKNCGETSINEMRQVLNVHGLKFFDGPDDPLRHIVSHEEERELLRRVLLHSLLSKKMLVGAAVADLAREINFPEEKLHLVTNELLLMTLKKIY
jgi:hypothetical protein